MSKLKLKTLLEGYAWERKADGSLPTLKDSIAVHEANKAKKEPRWQDSDGDGKWYEPEDLNEYGEEEFDRSSQMYSGGKSRSEGKEILDLVSEAENVVQNLRRNMATNSVLQREEKMGYLRAYDELLDLLSDIGFQAEMTNEAVDEQYGNRRGKFGKGSRYNDEPDFDRGVVNLPGAKVNNMKVTEWDKIVDEFNNKPGYEVETNITPRLYAARITNTSTGDIFQVRFKNQWWHYEAEIGGAYKYLRNLDELIEKFNELNRSNEEAKPDYIDLDGDGNETESMKKAAHDKEMKTESAYKNATNNELASHIGQLTSELKAEKDRKKQEIIRKDLEACKSELKSRKQNESLTTRDLDLISKFKKNLNESARRY